jgi:hypothetical protein
MPTDLFSQFAAGGISGRPAESVVHVFGGKSDYFCFFQFSIVKHVTFSFTKLDQESWNISAVVRHLCTYIPTHTHTECVSLSVRDPDRLA